MAQTIGSLDLNAFSDLYSDSIQYFWFESNSSATYGAGVHVTLVPDTSFIANPTGQNILMNTDGFSIRNGLLPMMTLDNDSLDFNVVDINNSTYANVATFGVSSRIGSEDSGNLLARSNGIAVRNELTELAVFGANGAIIGISDGTESYLSLDYHSLQLIDKEGTTYFYVSDLRDANGYAEVTEYFTANGDSRSYTLQFLIQSPDGYSPTVTVDNVSETYTYYSNVITLTNTPAAGSTVKIIYKTKNALVKSYTFGIRKNGESVGAMSVAEGYQTTASGIFSHAEGYNTVADEHYCHAEGVATIASYGDGSHAEGSHSEAQGSCSHAEGKYTVASDAYSHSQNYYTIAAKQAQTALGTYNEEDTSNQTTHPSNILDYGQFAVIIGNGTADNARSNALMVDWNGDIYPRATKMTDFVVDEGTSGNWTYRKWNSGKAEAWTLASNGSTKMTTAEGYGYYAPAKTYTFPSIFTTIKSVVTLADLSGALGGFVSSNITTTSLTGYFWATRSVTKNTFLNIEVKGTWK